MIQSLTDERISVSYLSSGGKAGETINVLAVCEKREPPHKPRTYLGYSNH